jgi:hypothetical protein
MKFVRSQLRWPISRTIGPCAFLLLVVCASSAHSQSTFTSMAGSWSGSGLVQLRTGTHERVRCKASYITPSNGQSLKLELRCASDAYNFDLSSNIVQTGASILGDWFESTNRVGGKISGQNNGGVITARAEGDVVTALLTVKTTGSRQSFLMESPGAQVERVSIDLHR